ncbi:uncharacterized protein L199_004134 [Kwoniella botswanensis]|uniref:uncharacterized protein n=1 Tax=Kwoniella botswanensis TaxID=1268659 RepID=UPI00315DE305
MSADGSSTGGSFDDTRSYTRTLTESADYLTKLSTALTIQKITNNLMMSNATSDVDRQTREISMKPFHNALNAYMTQIGTDNERDRLADMTNALARLEAEFGGRSNA